jgi:putative ABC transport system permease protein
VRFAATWNTAFAALGANKARTALTSLGITIGISAVIALVAAGTGAKAKLDDALGSIGPNLVVAMAGAKTRSGLTVGGADGVFTREDAAAIRHQLRHLINGCSEVTQSRTFVGNGTGTYFTAFAGGMPEIKRIRRWEMLAGRFYDEGEVKRQDKVAVLGKTVADKLFPNIPSGQIVGKTIRAGDHRFSVVGILQPKGTNLIGADQDDVILIPITTLLRKVSNQEKCQLITVEARSTELVPQVREKMEKLLHSRHGIREGKEANYRVNSIREMAALAETFTGTLTILIYAIASVSLVVGGIGVMNIMLVSVTERTREIGIRMAVGARTVDVLNQFLTEAVILALFGGMIGIAVGAAGAYAIAQAAHWKFVVSPGSVLIAVATSAAVGIFFGFYPARKASLLDPIDALRYE